MADLVEGENAYERQRRETIERNRARLHALGIPGLVASLQTEAPRPKAPQKKRVKRKREPGVPTRKSRRLDGQDAAADDVDEEASELARFVIDGDCPYCGKVLQQNHKAHLERCIKSGRPRKADVQRALNEAQEGEEEEAEDAEELQRIAMDEEAERTKRQDQKLHELHLNGLVDFDKGHAKFVVLGSTKKHYNVTLMDHKQTCECMDFRLRRHTCKHIRLVLTQLGIADTPQTWHEALSAKLKDL